jgi:hypothetical protein
MNMRFLLSAIINLGAVIVMTACAFIPQSPTPETGAIALTALERAYVMLTQTAQAASPTPTATMTFTPTPTPTKTSTPGPTNTNVPLKRPLVTAATSCWYGPGPQYAMISHLSANRYVELLGTGSVPGWYIIVNPYYRTPCWVEAIYLKLDPRVDTSKYPVMTPTNP